MITASLWVPRGAAATFPTRYDIDEDELARISKFAKLQLEDAHEDLEVAKNGSDDEDEAGYSNMGLKSGVKATQSKA